MLLLDRSESKTHKAQIYRMTVDLHFTKGEIRRSVDTALEGLRLLGIDLPVHPSREEVQEEYEEVQRNLGGRPIEALLDLPLMTDPDMRAAMRILGVLWAPALSVDANLTALHVGRMVNLCLQHGNADAAIMGYASWGVTLINIFHQYREGYRFGDLAHRLMVKHGFFAYESKLYYSLEVISPWVKGIPSAIELAKKGFLAGVERGDLPTACYCCNHLVNLLIAQGTHLREVHEEAERRAAFVRAARFQDVVEIISSMQRYVQNMRGLTRSFSTFDDDHFDEGSFEASFSPDSMACLVFWYWILKMQARFMGGDHAVALSAAQKARDMLWASPPSHLQIHDFHLYSALLLSAMYDKASPEEQRRYDASLSEHRAQLKEWAESCPGSFLASHALVSAEAARLEGKALEAIELYEQAIRAARDNGFVQNEALSNELAGRFYLGRGLTTTAKGHLREAHACYVRWGADGKARQLEQLYPDLLEPKAPAVIATFTATPQQLDIVSITKHRRASRARSSCPGSRRR